MTQKPSGTEQLALLGLAQRAGALVRGTEAVRRALRAGAVHLVLVANDASPGQLGKVEGLLRNRGIPRIVSADRARLGAALGAAPLSAVGVTDRGWADRLRAKPDASAERR